MGDIHLLDLPTDVLLFLLGWMPFRDAVALSVTCTALRTVARREIRIQRARRVIEADPRYDYDFGCEPHTVELIEKGTTEEFDYVFRRRRSINEPAAFSHWFEEAHGAYLVRHPLGRKATPMQQWCPVTCDAVRYVYHARCTFIRFRESPPLHDIPWWDSSPSLFAYRLCIAVRQGGIEPIAQEIKKHQFRTLMPSMITGEIVGGLPDHMFPVSADDRSLKTLARYVIRYGAKEDAILLLDRHVCDLIHTIRFSVIEEGGPTYLLAFLVRNQRS